MTQVKADQAATSHAAAPVTPVLPTAVKDAKATRELMFSLRHFHLGDPGAQGVLESVGEDFLPALLDPFRDTSRLRYDYPLFLHAGDGDDARRKAADLASTLADWLQRAVAGFAPDEGAARILKDHLQWLEHHLRGELGLNEGPQDAAARLAQAGEALQSFLHLDPSSRERLGADLDNLVAQVPPGARLLGYGRYAALHLLVQAVRSRVLPRRKRFSKTVANCIRGLKELFQVEWSKSTEAIEPAHARQSVGPGADLFDAASLSEVMDHSRGTRRMSDSRRARIESAWQTLEQWRDEPELVHFVHGRSLSGHWLEGDASLSDLEDEDPCARATRVFDELATRLSRVFAAVRIAQLEINGIYDEAMHDPWFANFSWEGFSQDELLMVPSVIAIESADRVAGAGLQSFSRLLGSGRPVQILIRVQPSNNPGSGPDDNPFASYRTELGYLAVSHRQAVVAQSSGARYEHLLECYLTALDATRTSLHIINTGLRPKTKLVPLNAWLVAGAALEGRAHPFFHINPEAGDYAASSMSFEGNPQPENDWPVHPFHYQDENGNGVDLELAFTFADYALLVDRMRNHFRLIPPGCDSSALVSIQAWLAMKPDLAYQHVPFVWGVDGHAQLHRLVVSRELAMGARDRLNYWHILQEMAGVRNPYVDQAVERTRAEETGKAREERERLQAAHAAELEKVREEAAGEAMQRLTDVLLGMDLAAPASPFARATPARAAAPAEVAAAAETAPAEPMEEDDVGLSFDEPWVDTPLCTSCNDCMKINPLLFTYNEDKQAMIGDLSKSTYAEMVTAAELCPARCIHPGKPWNQSEPGLEGLIERAAPFNR